LQLYTAIICWKHLKRWSW